MFLLAGGDVEYAVRRLSGAEGTMDVWRGWVRAGKAFAAILVAICCAGTARAQETPPPMYTPANEGAALSTRVVNYQIDARLDTAKKTIDATEWLTYKNLTGKPQQTFPFHLYLNAFQPKSTFMTEVRLYGTRGTSAGSGWDPKHYGAITISKFEVPGMGDLTDKMQFIQPDDGNTNDHTVMQVTLPKPIAPGASVQFRMVFHDQLPYVVERTGYVRDFFMVGQWFPKVGVWWQNAWNCHQFHATTEFFSDFGTYDVRITLPQNEIVGAGGDLIASNNNADGTKSLIFHSQDVIDFSWTAYPHFTDVEDSWTGSAGTVKLHVLMSPGHMATAPRYIKVLKGAMTLFDKRYGPYPYDRLTVVDPPHGAEDAGGMEYPTLITAGTGPDLLMPKGVLLPEVVAEHEWGHQYWYAMVATNEFEDAWMDEGINSYTEAKVMGALYGAKTSAIDFPFAQMSDFEEQRLGYLAEPDADPMTRFGWEFRDDGSYGAISYGKTATVLLTLERIIGSDKMQEAMHEYFMKYRFKHPTPEDFMNTIQQVAGPGQDLSWYFAQAFKGTQILDYEVEDIRSDRANWYEAASAAKKKGPVMYRDTVVVQRKGDFIAPVDLEVKFDDGTTAHERWDGKDRWIRYSYMRPAQIESAEIDPQHKMWMDRDFYNDSQTADGDGRASRKIGDIFLFVSEWLNQLLAYLT
ncbi:MAG TPA: M1 family metallopeptidase [Candidatus Acidoferrales bacterium]|nr:M1 family metallopeptidase [Candidatus Acidoferrales bacterium]